jgi:hypothetical protein
MAKEISVLEIIETNEIDLQNVVALDDLSLALVGGGEMAVSL